MRRVAAATAAAVAVCLLLCQCGVTYGQQCVMPPSGQIAAQCERTRTLSGGMAGTRWAYNWRAQRCHRVALSCDDTVWTLFDTKKECMEACRQSPAGHDDRPGWNPPASVHATTQHPTPAPTTTKPHRICNAPIDLVILLDSSVSIEKEIHGGCPGCFYSVVRSFAEALIDRRIDCTGQENAPMRFAVWRFGEPHSHSSACVSTKSGSDGFDFATSAGLTNYAINEKVKEITYYASGTDINVGFKCAGETMRASPRRADGEVKRIVVLITDGQADYPAKARSEAKQLRDDATSVIVVGFGKKMNKTEMAGYAGTADLTFDLQESGPLPNLNKIVSRIQICYHCLVDYAGRGVHTCDDQRCVDRFG